MSSSSTTHVSTSPRSRGLALHAAAMAVCAAVAGVAATRAQAAPTGLSPVRDVVIGDSNTTEFGAASPSLATGAFSDSVTDALGGSGNSSPIDTTATQDSLINGPAGLFTGSGLARIDFSAGPNTGVFAGSFFDVFFDLSEPYNFVLAGLLDTSNDGGLAISQFQLGIDGDPLLIDVAAVNNSASVDLANAGVLGPGTYELFVGASMEQGQETGFYGGQSTFDFTLTLTPLRTPPGLPEPTPLALLCVAALGLSLRLNRGSPASRGRAPASA